ncbi:MAG: hypothetical protein WD156_08890 [Acidimicrobiia bacterium]
MTDQDFVDNCRLKTRLNGALASIQAHAHPADFRFGDAEALLIDLLTDLRHWAARQKWQERKAASAEEALELFDYAVRLSAFHYPEDLADCRRVCHREGIEPDSRCVWAT